MDVIRTIVSYIGESDKKSDLELTTQISAAVFPYPEMSRQMVRQDTSKWGLDIICPMNYNHFYRIQNHILI